MKYWVLFFLLCVSFTLNAQDKLSIIESRLAKFPLVCGAFTQTKEMATLDAPLISKGRFCVDQEKGILWRVLSPYPNAVKIQENTLIYYKNDQAVKRLNAENEPSLQTMNRVIAALLSGDMASLRQLFTLQASVDSQRWVITLKPKDARLARVMSAIVLRGNTYITDIETTERGGTRAETRFSQIVTDRHQINADDLALLFANE